MKRDVVELRNTVLATEDSPNSPLLKCFVLFNYLMRGLINTQPIPSETMRPRFVNIFPGEESRVYRTFLLNPFTDRWFWRRSEIKELTDLPLINSENGLTTVITSSNEQILCQNLPGNDGQKSVSIGEFIKMTRNSYNKKLLISSFIVSASLFLYLFSFAETAEVAGFAKSLLVDACLSLCCMDTCSSSCPRYYNMPLDDTTKKRINSGAISSCNRLLTPEFCFESFSDMEQSLLPLAEKCIRDAGGQALLPITSYLFPAICATIITVIVRCFFTL